MKQLFPGSLCTNARCFMVASDGGDFPQQHWPFPPQLVIYCVGDFFVSHHQTKVKHAFG